MGADNCRLRLETMTSRTIVCGSCGSYPVLADSRDLLRGCKFIFVSLGFSFEQGVRPEKESHTLVLKSFCLCKSVNYSYA